MLSIYKIIFKNDKTYDKCYFRRRKVYETFGVVSKCKHQLSSVFY